MIGDLTYFLSLIETEPSLINTNITQTITDLVENELKYIELGNTTLKPGFIKIIDLAIYLSM